MIDGGLWHTDDPEVPSQRVFLQVRDVLYRGTSPYQEIAIIETVLFGRALVLNNVLQTAERDEFCYHEMLVHPAMIAHPNPRRVLIIGGGDGGALRRVLQHPVEHVTMVEIDEQVVEACRAHLWGVHRGAFDDPRVELRFEDGFAYVERRPATYDVIIVDGPDPLGDTPGMVLFSPDFYHGLADMLAPGGLVVQQTESPMLLPIQTAATHLHLREVLPIVRTYLTMVQSYDSYWSFAVASRDVDPAALDMETVAERLRARGIDECQYYSPEIHWGAFRLPPFLRRFIEESIALGRPADAHPLLPEAAGRRPTA
uniref:Polyamine aminopropyltransferase n=1 Tax=Thermomicrobium roseum TaxID=500 RepID=A0A7C5RUK1_THERO